MNRTILIAAALFSATIFSTAHSANFYWDQNDTTAGAGATTGTWDTTTANWQTPTPDPPNPDIPADPTGSNPTGTWVNSELNVAVFSAGTDMASSSYSVNIASGISAGGITVEEGTVALISGTVDLSSASNKIVKVMTGATLDISSSSTRVKLTPGVYGTGGQYTLDGGTLSVANAVYGANVLVTANGGTINVNSGIAQFGRGNAVDGIDSFGQLAATVTIQGAGGTTTNGGAQTLVKTGAGEMRPQGNGMANNTYAKVVVNQGLFRLGSQSSAGGSQETAFGATPIAPTADAITLDGGFIGASTANFSLHPNRGITIGSSGGGLQGAVLIAVPGPLTGSGDLIINGTGGLALNHANNVSTFTGRIEMRSAGFVNINESLVSPELFGTGAGTISIAAGKSLTVGSSGNSSTYSGGVAGAGGTFTKVGGGTIAMGNGILAGTINVNEGTLQYGATAADVGDRTTTVNIAFGATVDMQGIVDIIGGLSGAGSVINHNGTTNGTGGNTATTANQMTLLGPGTYDFSGTIDGTGAVIHSGIGTQTFGGANTYQGGTTVSAGKLMINNTTGSATGSGAVTVSGTGTLGGTGLIDMSLSAGSISVASGGRFVAGGLSAPNNNVIDVATTGSTAVDIQSGGFLGATLGDPGKSDRVMVTTANALNLSFGGILTLNGASDSINGEYKVVDHNGLTGGSALTNLTLNNATGFELDLTDGNFPGGVRDTGAAFEAKLTNTQQNRTWTVDGGGSWSFQPGEVANFSGGNGGGPNGPGAIANFDATATPSARTVTITDSDKNVGTLNFNDGAGGSYNIAASGGFRLVTAKNSGDAAINLTAGSHAISAPLTTLSKANVSANGNTLTVSGGIANKAGLVNTGTGTLAISSSNAATSVANNSVIGNSAGGTVTINTTGTGSFVNNSNGTISNSGSGNLTITIGNTGTNIGLINNGLVVNSGSGGLTITNSGGTSQPIATNIGVSDLLNTGADFGGTFLNTGTGPMTISAGIVANAGVTFGGEMTVSGAISGTSTNNFGNFLGKRASVTIDGPGTVKFTATNTYSARTYLKSGKLEITADGQLGSVHTASGAAGVVTGGAPDQITFDGGTLKSAHTAAVTINASRGMHIKSGGGTMENSNSSGALNYAGRVLAEGNFAKTGPTGVTLSGIYTLNTGGLRIASNAGTLTLSGTVVGKNTNVTMGGTNTITASGTINIGTGTLTKDGAGTLTLSNTVTPTVSNTIGTITGTAGTLTLSGNNSTTTTLNVSGGTTTASSTFSALSQVNVTGGTATLSGTFAPIVTPPNPQTVISVNLSAGIVNLSGTYGVFNALTATGGRANFGASTITNGTINLTPSAGNIQLSTTGTSPVTATLGSAIPIVSNSSTNSVDAFATTNNTLNINGDISGNGAWTKGLAGSAGTVGLNGDNNAWSGGVTLKTGILSLGHKNGLGSAPLNVASSAANAAQKPIFQTSVDLTGANAIGNNVIIDNPAGAAPQLNLNGSFDYQFNGVISDKTGGTAGGTIIKESAGANTVTFVGANTYTGGTTIDNGKIMLAGAAATLGTGSVTVNGANFGSALVINSDVLNGIADTATLSLAGGNVANTADQGYADLLGSINETVNSLLLGGVAQLPGTYGSLTSGAMFQSDEYFAGTGMLTVLSSGIPGDYDNTGAVDAADYVMWRMVGNNAGSLPFNEVGPDGLGTTNSVDYDRWAARFNNPNPGAAAANSLGNNQAVPEPATIGLMLLGIAVAALSRRSPR